MTVEEMTFEQFVAWATGRIVFGIGAGQPLNSLVYEVLNNFILHWLPAHGWKKVG